MFKTKDVPSPSACPPNYPSLSGPLMSLGTEAQPQGPSSSCRPWPPPPRGTWEQDLLCRLLLSPPDASTGPRVVRELLQHSRNGEGHSCLQLFQQTAEGSS